MIFSLGRVICLLVLQSVFGNLGCALNCVLVENFMKARRFHGLVSQAYMEW